MQKIPYQQGNRLGGASAGSRQPVRVAPHWRSRTTLSVWRLAPGLAARLVLEAFDLPAFAQLPYDLRRWFLIIRMDKQAEFAADQLFRVIAEPVLPSRV